jgi:hypothetical protein
VTVTRLKWRTTIPGLTPGIPLRAAPGLDSAGTLYIGVDETGTTGKLHALNPHDGSPRPGFPRMTGAVQSVAVALSREPGTTNGPLEVVYTNANTATEGRIDMWAADGGAPVGSAYANTNLRTSSALALFRAGIQTPASIGGVAHFNGATGQLASTSPAEGTSTTNSNAAYVLPVPGMSSLASPVNLVASPDAGTTTVYFATSGPGRAVHGFPYVAGLGWQSTVMSSPTLGGTGGTAPTGLALAGDGLLVSLENTTPVRALPRTLAAFSDVVVPVASLVDGAGPVAVSQRLDAGTASASVVFGSNVTASANWLLSAAFDTTTASFPASAAGAAATTSASRLVTSPVIGGGGLPRLGAPAPDRLYTVTSDGTLRVLQVSPTTGVVGATPEWSDTVFGMATKTVYAHPTLDCFRPAPDGGVPLPGRPGTLYVVATDGTVAAILVDSQKLSTTAPWPKWQRTAGNAGNTDSSLFPLNPGCPP